MCKLRRVLYYNRIWRSYCAFKIFSSIQWDILPVKNTIESQEFLGSLHQFKRVYCYLRVNRYNLFLDVNYETCFHSTCCRLSVTAFLLFLFVYVGDSIIPSNQNPQCSCLLSLWAVILLGHWHQSRTLQSSYNFHQPCQYLTSCFICDKFSMILDWEVAHAELCWLFYVKVIWFDNVKSINLSLYH